MKCNKNIIRLICLLVSLCFIIPAYANSAMTFWSGTDISGTVTADENCPVEVVQENLSFSLPDPATNLIITPGEYRNSFTAEYTFENPSDMDVRVLLSFPIPANPYGARSSFEDEQEISDRYQITADGKAVEIVHRYTWQGGSDFDLRRDLAGLKDGYTEDSFFRPDMSVWKYTWQVHVDEQDTDQALLECGFDYPDTARRYLIRPYYGGLDFSDDQMTVRIPCRDGETFSLYVFGRKLNEDPEWQLRESMDIDQQLKGSAGLTDISEETYEEYVLSLRPQGKPISDTDWYNAVTEEFDTTCNNDMMLSYPDETDRYLLHWMQYELHFEPHERIVNAVSAPVYPSVNTGYDYPVFGYTYLLSPASSWKDFKALDITVETPMEMIETSLKGFEKTDSGYHIAVEGLPKGELLFSLCEVGSPKRKSNPLGYVVFIALALFVLFLILIVVLIGKLIGRLFRRN